MTLQSTQNLAYKLMKEHNLLGNGWSFEFDNAVKRFGCCNHTHKTISLSKKLCLLNDEANVKDTILHEIAHALVGSGNGHNRVWQRKCIEIGAKPERCYTSTDVISPTLKWFAECKPCGKVFQKAKNFDRTIKRACPCQSHLSWDKKALLEYKERK